MGKQSLPVFLQAGSHGVSTGKLSLARGTLYNSWQLMSSRSYILTILYTVSATCFITVMTGAVLFVSAWRLDIPVFWAFLGVMFVSGLVGFMLIDPDLIKERQKPGPGAQDMAAMYIAKLLLTSCLVLAGLDVGRFHWSDILPMYVQIAAMAVMSAGLAFALWAIIINRYFSSVVRIQEERGHQLITTGPYRIVRHPGYTGLIVVGAALGFALGSLYAAIPALGYVILILRRVRLEDPFLHKKLDGYNDYAQQVRWRLLPGVW